eukprot:TRINITY_DN696_c0_g1_i1.p1 TRINITY_DN696_c0_g1~~TRINITY_DN696_c0_g1_i1.p1  ORF type:complete len:494 (-),score=121.95 TRINITY_DN696_c0_g1_i1:1081-2562(-)
MSEHDKLSIRKLNKSAFEVGLERFKEGPLRSLIGGKKISAKRGARKHDHVQVFVRKRPFVDEIETKDDFDVVTVLPKAVILHDCRLGIRAEDLRIDHYNFQTDRTFDVDISDTELYEQAVFPLVQDASASGRHCALVLFGQTGSGKTYTMTHMLQILTDQLFQNVHGVAVTAVEMDGENCDDLFSEPSSKAKVSVLEDGEGKAWLKFASELVATDRSELRRIIDDALARRRKSLTRVHSASSRTHGIIRLQFIDKKGELQSGELLLIDLAGAEKRYDSLFHSPDQQRESLNINKSLYALKECIDKFRKKSIAGPETKIHVPYRLSKLSLLLKHAFHPESRLHFIATLSPSSHSTEHGMNVLRYVTMLMGNDGHVKPFHATSVSADWNYLELEKKFAESLPPVDDPGKWSVEDVDEFFASILKSKNLYRLPSSTTGKSLTRWSERRFVLAANGDVKHGKILFETFREKVKMVSARDEKFRQMKASLRKKGGAAK